MTLPRDSVTLVAIPANAPWYWRAWGWLTAPFVDGQEGLSLTRFLAVYFASLVGVSVNRLNGVISANALWLALASASIAFGKSTFSFLLRRISLKSEIAQTDTTSTSTETRTENVNITQKIIDERHPEDGSPPRSMPAVAAAVPE